MFTLLVNEYDKKWHDHFVALNSLFYAIDEVCDKCNDFGGYPSFSGTGEEKPIDKWEVVMTILDDDKILHPVSAGGNWRAYDDYTFRNRNCCCNF